EEYVRRLGEQKVQEKLNALKSTWEQMLRERVSELEGNLQNAEAAVKTAKPEEKKAAENLRDSLRQELDKVKDQAAKKNYDALNKACWGRRAYAADVFRLLTTYNTPCLGCHQVGNLPPKEPQGPPLQLSAERLRPDWTLRWIANPDRLLSYP